MMAATPLDPARSGAGDRLEALEQAIGAIRRARQQALELAAAHGGGRSPVLGTL